MFRPD